MKCDACTFDPARGDAWSHEREATYRVANMALLWREHGDELAERMLTEATDHLKAVRDETVRAMNARSRLRLVEPQTPAAAPTEPGSDAARAVAAAFGDDDICW